MTQWASLIQECRSSGMTNRAWCDQNDVNEKQFYNWQRRVRKEAFQELQEAASSDHHPPGRLVELPAPHSREPVSDHRPPDLVLKYGQFTLEIQGDVSPDLLDLVLKAVSHVE